MPADKDKLNKALGELAEGKTEVDFKGLDVSSSQLDRVCRELAEKGNRVEGLSFGRCGLGDDGARKIAASLPSLVNLQRLDLTDNQIGAEGAKSIAASLPSLVNLQGLDLTHNQIGADGAKAIAASLPSVPQHTVTRLLSNKIGVDLARAIESWVPSLANLIDLHLGLNQLSDVGVLSLAEAVRHSVSLKTLDVADPNISKSAWDQLNKSLAGPRTPTLPGKPAVSSG